MTADLRVSRSFREDSMVRTRDLGSVGVLKRGCMRVEAKESGLGTGRLIDDDNLSDLV